MADTTQWQCIPNGYAQEISERTGKDENSLLHEREKGDAKVETDLPKTMKALQYSAPREFSVVELPLPELGDHDVLVKISACGVCGTDLHFHEGEFMAKFPLIPGHEATGTVVALGGKVTNLLHLGQRVVADPLVPCQECFYCRRGQALHCEHMTGHGGNVPGGFAEYSKYPIRNVHSIHGLSNLEAVLVEPASCAAHGIDRIQPKLGSNILIFGCGPTGILLAQLLRQNGGCSLTIASRGGPKLDLAKKLQVADSYVCLSETDPEKQLEALGKRHPHGFDVVVEATGARAVLEDSVNYVRKGGKLVVYGVYGDDVKVAWSPSKIWANEITILASFCETLMFPLALDYLESKKVCVQGIVNRTYRIEEWAQCLEAVRKQEVVKAAIVFD